MFSNGIISSFMHCVYRLLLLPRASLAVTDATARPAAYNFLDGTAVIVAGLDLVVVYICICIVAS